VSLLVNHSRKTNPHRHSRRPAADPESSRGESAVRARRPDPALCTSGQLRESRAIYDELDDRGKRKYTPPRSARHSAAPAKPSTATSNATTTAPHRAPIPSHPLVRGLSRQDPELRCFLRDYYRNPDKPRPPSGRSPLTDPFREANSGQRREFQAVEKRVRTYVTSWAVGRHRGSWTT
jgi:hypothetical protein